MSTAPTASAVPLEEGGLPATTAEAVVPTTTTKTWLSGMTCFWTLLRLCHTFALGILAAVVTFLFLQVQYLQYEMQQEQDALLALQDQIQNQTAGQIQELTVKVDQNHSLTLFQMAGTFSLLTCLLTMFHMSTHLRHYHEPIVQRKIVTILWMSPIYAVTSFLSLVFPAADGYLAVVKDFYEAYVVYTFLSFLIAVLGRGNREAVVDVLAQHAHHLAKPTKLLSRYYYPPPETSDRAMANAVLMECQLLAMQFVLVRPLTSICGFVATTLREAALLEQDDEDASSSWSYFKSPGFFIAMITNVSVFLAFRGLLRFYHAVREDLRWLQPFSKFMAIKGIVFLTFWQGLLITIIVQLQHQPATQQEDQSDAAFEEQQEEAAQAESVSQKTPRQQAAEIQNVLICLEMLLFSIAHWCTYPADEWEPNYRPKRYAKPGIGLKDFASDMSYMIRASGAKRKGQRLDPDASNQDFYDEDTTVGEVIRPRNDYDTYPRRTTGQPRDDEDEDDALQTGGQYQRSRRLGDEEDPPVAVDQSQPTSFETKDEHTLT